MPPSIRRRACGAGGYLKVPVSDFGDMVYQLWRLAMAMGNDPNTFRELCGDEPEAAAVGQHAQISEEELDRLLTRATPEEEEKFFPKDPTPKEQVN